MRRRSPLPAGALLAASLVMALGCGDGRPAVDSSLTEAKVRGVVKVKGVPAEGGEISFNPSNVERKVATKTAKIGKDGAYEVTTYTGWNRITFGGDIVQKHNELGLAIRAFEVASGENNLDLDLLGENDGGKRVSPTIRPMPAGR